MLQTADSRRRFVMPKEAKISANMPANVEVLPDGRVMITPLVTIPRHEQWAHTPESFAQTAASLKDYQENRAIDAAELTTRITTGAKKRGGK